MEAYNRWLAEYCSYAPNRLFGCGQAAVADADGGVEELEAIAEAGFVGVMMSGMPGTADYDDPAYDRLWAKAVELDLPLCFHILTNKSYSGHRGPKINALLNVVRTVQDVIGMLIFSGVFDRHPGLKVVGVESDAGWAPALRLPDGPHLQAPPLLEQDPGALDGCRRSTSTTTSG